LFRRVDRRQVIAGEETRLELSDPVVTFQEGAGGLTCCALLEGALRELTIIEGAERRVRSPQSPDQGERSGNSVEEGAKPFYELQSVRGFALDLIQWMAQGEKNGTQSPAGMRGKCRIAVVSRHLEGATYWIDSLCERPCPGNHNREKEIGSSA